VTEPLFDADALVAAADERVWHQRQRATGAVAEYGFTVRPGAWAGRVGEYWYVGTGIVEGSYEWVLYYRYDSLWGRTGRVFVRQRKGDNWRYEWLQNELEIESKADAGEWLRKRLPAVRAVVGAKEAVTTGTMTIPAFETLVTEAHEALVAIDRARGIEIPERRRPVHRSNLHHAVMVGIFLACYLVSLALVAAVLS
jgi:hypothetical protein